MSHPALVQIDHPSAWRASEMANPALWQATLPGPVLDELLAAGQAVSAEHALPTYIRDKVAQTTAERMAIKAAQALAAQP